MANTSIISVMWVRARQAGDKVLVNGEYFSRLPRPYKMTDLGQTF
jgi:hypothetical protein